MDGGGGGGGGGGAVPVDIGGGHPCLQDVIVIIDIVRWVETEVTDPCLYVEVTG